MFNNEKKNEMGSVEVSISKKFDPSQRDNSFFNKASMK